MHPLILSGRYQVRQALATGGMGQTFLAEDTHLPGNPVCVVKQLKPESNEPGFLATAKRLFFSEAETLQKLGTHAQIPRLLAYFEENNEFYLVQEYIEGLPLSKEILLGQRWSESRVIQLLQDILGVLSFVHRQGVIHRDLKPDNMIRREADQKLVLIDFGAVKHVRTQSGNSLIGNAAAGSPAPANKTVAIGTRGYMPSEQLNGRPHMSSDLYAVGKIAIQALTGLLPTQLREDADSELVWRDQASVSDGLAAFLTKMVRDYHKHRYQSSDEALQALEQLTGAAASIPQPAYTPTVAAEATPEAAPEPTPEATPEPKLAASPPPAAVEEPAVSQLSSPTNVPSRAPLSTTDLEESATVMVSPGAALSTTSTPVHSTRTTRTNSRRNFVPLLAGIGTAALVMIGGAIAYHQWQTNTTATIEPPDSSTGNGSTSDGSASSGKNQPPTPEPEVTDNPFETVAFPQATCGDTNVSKPFYRIYILNARLESKVSADYCEDAFVEKRTGRLKVASFDTEERAEHFKEYMEDNVGSVAIEVVRN